LPNQEKRQAVVKGSTGQGFDSVTGTVWNGSYYQDESAARRDARVSLDSAGVRVDAVLWPFDALVQKSGTYPGEPTRLDYGRELVVVSDRSFAYELHRVAPQFGSAMHDPSARSTVATILAVWAGILAALVVIAWLSWPWMERAAVAAIPRNVEEAMGKATVTQLTALAPTCNTVELNNVVNGLVKRLAGESSNNPYIFRVTIVDQPIVNALAAPGGYIVVYRGLIQHTDSADELAGVLAHEMQHVNQRHSVRGALRGVGIMTVIALLFGDASSVATASGELAGLSFQRGDEEEADREGMASLQQARLDPNAMVTVYERLARESSDLPGALKYLSTHPQMSDRVEKLKALAGEARYTPVRVVTNSRWAELKSECR
jgi:beta-barrel assembly-enhancing protease